MTGTSSTPGFMRPFVVWVDSAEEQYAYLTATFGDPASWSVTSQSYEFTADGREFELADVHLSSGEQIALRFTPATIEADPFGGEKLDDRTGLMDELMEMATGFASRNPPHHPGSLARYPVPSASYAHAISIPLPILAINGERRGLYAPPRVVAIDWQSREPIGAGEFPDFDPETWPPPLLGDWPPAQTLALPQAQLQGMIARFSACWSRVLDTWFARDVEPAASLPDDIRDALHYRRHLDLPEMTAYYDRLNPVFSNWLAKIQDTSANA